MRRFPFLSLLGVPLLAACASAPARQPGETEARCIHRLYDYPARSEPFQVAADSCAGGRVVDLTGDRYYQVLARSLNVPFVSHDPHGTDSITLTGSRLPQSTDTTPPPELSLR